MEYLIYRHGSYRLQARILQVGLTALAFQLYGHRAIIIIYKLANNTALLYKVESIHIAVQQRHGVKSVHVAEEQARKKGGIVTNAKAAPKPQTTSRQI